MAKEKDLRELFHDTLKDIYFAEKKILTALPKMARAAQSENLKAAFEKHEGETEKHVARLEQVFETIDEAPKGKTCDAIMGIIEEGQEVMKEYKGTAALDAGMNGASASPTSAARPTSSHGACATTIAAAKAAAASSETIITRRRS